MSKKPAKSSQIFFRVSAHDTIVLVDIDENDFFFEIEGIASDLWKEIDGKKSWEEIKNLHRDNCELSNSEFDDVSDKFLQELVDRKFVTLSE